MFSANENIALRQHKRRVIEYVEECIPDEILDLGATCMAMQVSCQAPGCVPLETILMILFPKSPQELIPGISESKDGGTLKQKVLLPMADISKQNVVEALPPPLGTRSLENVCFQARDVMLAQITQLVGDEDVEGRHMMADYLKTCLEEYKQRGCIAPNYGEPFEPINPNETQDFETMVEQTETTSEQSESDEENKPAVPAGNFVFRRNDNGGGLDISAMKNTKSTNDGVSISSTNDSNGVKGVGVNEDKNSATESRTTTSTATTTTTTPSTMDWRRRQTVERSMNNSSQSIISRLSEREHAPGVRMAGCPCCDPDNINNYVDSIMML